MKRFHLSFSGFFPQFHLRTSLIRLALVAVFQAAAWTGMAAAARMEASLNGEWEFCRDGQASWKKVVLPSSFESHEGENFDGVGWYRKTVHLPPLAAGQRCFLHFQAAATLAEVQCNGDKIGSHLGAWIPFRLDMTEALKKAPPGGNHTILVRLDEKVGHNTQGFLPIIAPHFGGLWQEVKWLAIPEAAMDDLNVMAIGDPDSGRLRLEIPFLKPLPESLSLRVEFRPLGSGAWRSLGDFALAAGARQWGAECAVPDFKLWSAASPALYEAAVSLRSTAGNPIDRITQRFAFRGIQADKDRLLLNGKPLNVRGVLTWGYYPPGTCPTLDESAFKRDMTFARERGFNLIKFCLWIPPKRFLELADEAGMLTWMEYPTWHPQLTPKHLEELRAEFREFFAYDRNHPSIILRSLTCETGPSASLEVIQSLYNMGHSMIPGAVLEDDSSWIGWNRVNDFYDDHPYGNNHTWVDTLGDLKRYIGEHPLKPLVLGEAMAADTWRDSRAWTQRLQASRPFWAPKCLDDQMLWETQMRQLHGPEGLLHLAGDSLHYALLMRKYQMETFRREVPSGGYVVSVIRDFPMASMGLIDGFEKPKWTPADFAWHGDTELLLETGRDLRSFMGPGSMDGRILLSHFGRSPVRNGIVSVVVVDEKGRIQGRSTSHGVSQGEGLLCSIQDFQVALPPLKKPEPWFVQAELAFDKKKVRNQWPVWIVPPPRELSAVTLNGQAGLNPLLQQALTMVVKQLSTNGAPDILVAHRFDDSMMNYLQAGGRVLLLPEGKGSLTVNSNWFLRGAPYIPQHPILKEIPRKLLVELQAFDLASDVIPDIQYLNAIDPILLLWDTHDSSAVKTHGLVYETRVGSGRLLVSALPHANNPAGRWLLSIFLDHLIHGPAPARALTDADIAYVRLKSGEKRIQLAEKEWMFRPDPQASGLAEGWQNPNPAKDKEWKAIRIGQDWESQGYPGMDGWAWYRLDLDIPADWAQNALYLNFEGVDDMYELYLNGQLAAKCGDKATRKDTFNERRSHDITPFLKPGLKTTIAVRVCDWQGAGGIFRPVTLSNAPLDANSKLRIN